MLSFNTGLITLTSFLFLCYLVLYAGGEKEMTVKQTSKDVMHLAVCISVLCVGFPESDA